MRALPSSLPRLSRLVGRHAARPVLHWLVVAALAVAAAVAVAVPASRAEEARRRHGELRPVLLAVHDLPAGHVLGPGDTELGALPAALVPPAAVDHPAEGVALTAAVYRGEPVVSGRLAPAGVGPVAALLPHGTRALAVPTGPGTPPLQPGDVVDVLATIEPSLLADGVADPTRLVAPGALVVAADDDAVTVAVSEQEATRVAFTLAHGVVTLALTPGAGGPVGGAGLTASR